MPSSVTILCQIKSKGMDGGFINGLASYMVEPKVFKTFHYRYYKKQISLFLCNLNVKDYVLICGKCIFNHKNMYVSITKIFNIIFYLLLKKFKKIINGIKINLFKR